MRCRRSVRGSSRWVSCSPGSCGACRWVPWRLRRGIPRCIRTGRSPWESTGAASRWCSRWCWAPCRGPGDGTDAAAGTVHVGDGDTLVHAQVSGVGPSGFVHVATAPVRERPLVAAGGACPAVAPDLPGAFGHTDRVGGLGEVHAAAHQARCFARLAACMSRSFSYLVPSNSYTMLRFLPNPGCCDVH